MNRSWTPEEIATILELKHKSGMSLSAIAEKFGASKNQIVGIWNRNKDLIEGERKITLAEGEKKQ